MHRVWHHLAGLDELAVAATEASQAAETAVPSRLVLIDNRDRQVDIHPVILVVVPDVSEVMPKRRAPTAATHSTTVATWRRFRQSSGCACAPDPAS